MVIPVNMRVSTTFQHLLIFLELMLASHMVTAWDYEHACQATLLEISCSASPETPFIHIGGGEYGVYGDSSCNTDCSCVPHPDDDCLVDMLDIDLELFRDECQMETECSVVVRGADIRDQCGIPSEFWRVRYLCTDADGFQTTVAPPAVSEVSSTTVPPDPTTHDDGGGDDDDGDSGSDVGAIVGAVLGTLLVVAIVVAILIYLLKCRKSGSKSQSSHPQTEISQLPPAADSTHSSLNPIPASDGEGGFAFDNFAYEATLKLSDTKKDDGTSNGAVKNGSATYENVTEKPQRAPRKLMVPSVSYNPGGGGAGAAGGASKRNSLAISGQSSLAGSTNSLATSGAGSRSSLAYPELSSNRNSIAYSESSSKRSSIAYPEPSSKRGSIAYPESSSKRSSVAYPESASKRSSVAYPESASKRSSVAYPESASKRSSLAIPESPSQTSTVVNPESSSKRSSVAYPESSSKRSSLAISKAPSVHSLAAEVPSPSSPQPSQDKTDSKETEPASPKDKTAEGTVQNQTASPADPSDKPSKKKYTKKKSKKYEGLKASGSVGNLSQKSADLGRSYESLASQAKSDIGSTAGHYEDVETKPVDTNKEDKSQTETESESAA